MRIGITGVEGLLGWHLRCRLHVEPGIEVVPANRATFGEQSSLDEFAECCDVIVHLAGVNRGHDGDVEAANPALAQQLVDSLERIRARPHVIYSSSIHSERDTPYGRSKRQAGLILQRWAEKSGAHFTNLILPHVFGEGARPFYNTVVATFCYQIAIGDEPKIDQDGELELLHAGDVADLILKAARDCAVGDLRPDGHQIHVSEMLARVTHLAKAYSNGVIPEFQDSLDLRLFNTYRYYLFPSEYPIVPTLHADERGSLFEAVKTGNGGQAFFSTTHPGVTRGDHFHFDKVERFLVVGGQATIRLRRLFDDEIMVFEVSGEEPAYVDMPTLYTHNITNTGSCDLLTLFWSHEIFDPDKPDTHHEKVTLVKEN